MEFGVGFEAFAGSLRLARAKAPRNRTVSFFRAAAVAEDSPDGGRHAELNGATPAKGILGGALKFDGRDDYVRLGDLGELPSAAIAFRMKTGAAAGVAPGRDLRNLRTGYPTPCDNPR